MIIRFEQENIIIPVSPTGQQNRMRHECICIRVHIFQKKIVFVLGLD